MAFKTLPDRMLRLVSAEDRKALGKAGLTAAECIERATIKSESDLQLQIISYLRLKGIEPIYQRMDKRTRTKKGTPDILFAVKHPRATEVAAIGLECKMSDGRISDEQGKMIETMMRPPNGWYVLVVYCLDQVIELLKRFGI